MSNAVTIIEFNDPIEGSSLFEAFDQDIVKLPCHQPFKALQLMLKMDGCTLLHYSTNISARARPRLKESHVAFVFFDSTAKGTMNGIPFSPNTVIFIPPGCSVVSVIAEGYADATILISLKTFSSIPGSDKWLSSNANNKTNPIPLQIGQNNSFYRYAKNLIMQCIKSPEYFNIENHKEIVKAELLSRLMDQLNAASSMEMKTQQKQERGKATLLAQLRVISLGTQRKMYKYVMFARQSA